MSGGARNNFNGQRWREELLRKRTKEALKCFPAAERHLHYNEEYKRQEAIYRQERDAKKRAKRALYERRMLKQAEIRAAYETANSQKASAGESTQ